MHTDDARAETPPVGCPAARGEARQPSSASGTAASAAQRLNSLSRGSGIRRGLSFLFSRDKRRSGASNPRAPQGNNLSGDRRRRAAIPEKRGWKEVSFPRRQNHVHYRSEEHTSELQSLMSI